MCIGLIDSKQNTADDTHFWLNGDKKVKMYKKQ